MSSKNWAGCCPKDTTFLSGLGDFRAAAERVRPAPGVALRLTSLLSEGLQGLFRQPYLQQVAGRHGMITADHHHVGEHLLQWLRNAVPGPRPCPPRPPARPHLS